jgi:hypothetical protein
MLLAAGTTACLIGVALSAAGGDQIATHPSIAQPGAPTEQHPRLPVCGRESFAFGAQAGAAPRVQMVEDVFKNVQVLNKMPVDDFMGTMGIMSASLGFCCSECHTGAGTDLVNWEADTPRKRTARRMVQMVTAINQANFGGRQVVTCWTCHRGRDRPVITPTLDTVYGAAFVEPDDVVAPQKGGPTADQVLDRYIEALGGAQRLAKVTSWVAKGTSVGYGGSGEGSQVEVVARSPDQRATRIRFVDPSLRDSVRSYDGKAGWLATPLTVVAEYELIGAELDGARLDAQMSFPGQIKQVLTNWRVGLPSSINDREMVVVQGSGPRGLLGTFYFDKETGLLTRMVRHTNSPIGRVPTQVDYAEYRDVDGIKVPFRWTFSWLDGQDSFEMSAVQMNVPVDAARFGRPDPKR